MGEMCTVCRRREPAHGQVCDPDVRVAVEQLTDLPRKLRLLPLMLMPGQSPGGEKVATTRVGSPTPARLDALSLIGPGSVPVPGALHPLMRRWSTSRTVQVQTRTREHETDTHTTTITEWHQEPVVDQVTGEPVLVPDDDQAGVLPPAEWLEQQVTSWRRAFGHRKRPATYVQPSRGPRPPRDPIGWVIRRGTAQQIATLFAVQDLARQFRHGVAQLVAGNEPGYAGRRPQNLREDDPVADLWTVRFGEPAAPRDSLTNIRYLHTWLAAAADNDRIDLGRFVTELRALSAELTRVLGEQPDQQWLGRCPAIITDPDGGRQACGAGLWQDPHASVVECPRCHSAWGPRVVHLIHLAAEIRRVWPLDRRRRYSGEERYALRPIGCPTCQQPIVVTWRPATGVGETTRWWRPVRTRCPQGCEAAGQIL